MKRKEKEKIANGLQDIALALPQLQDESILETSEEGKGSGKMDLDLSAKPNPPRKQRSGLIGEGKGVPLSEKQRRQILWVPRCYIQLTV